LQALTLISIRHMSTTDKKHFKFLLGKFKDPETTKESVLSLKAEGFKVYDVYSPFPIHGIEHAMGWNGTRLTTAAFLFGMLGSLAALSLQIFMMVIDWPMDIGGKPNFQGPAIVPITFELTVLFTAFGMAISFFFVNKMFPWRQVHLMDPKVTDDVFVVALDQAKITDRAKAEQVLRSAGAYEIAEKEIDDEFFDVSVG
jgi:hypothetical protein